MDKTNRPINRVGGVEIGGVVYDEATVTDATRLLEHVNQASIDCRSIPFGIDREQCYLKYVFPLLDLLNHLGYSVEWDMENVVYKLVEDGKEWVHPTIRRR